MKKIRKKILNEGIEKILVKNLHLFLFDEYAYKYELIRREGKRIIYFSTFTNRNLELIDELLYRTGYFVKSLLGYIKLLWCRRDASLANSIFLFKDPRNLKFCRKDLKALRVGLHWVNSNSSHLYCTLSAWEILGAFYSSFLILFTSISSIRRFSRDRHINLVSYYLVNGLGIIRILDLYLYIKSLKKVAHHEIQFAEQHNVYVSILNYLREENCIRKLVGFQHGFFNISTTFPNSQRFYVDEYHLLFPQSRRYFESINFNHEVLINTNKNISLNSSKYDGNASNIGIILQNDSNELNETLIKTTINSIHLNSIHYLVYLHPAMSKSDIDYLIDKFATDRVFFFKVERHSNLIFVVTRYSALALEYLNKGVDAFFCVLDENFCAMQEINQDYITRNFENLSHQLSNYEFS